MKNDLLEIVKRSHEIIDALKGGIPLSMYDAEMEVLDVLTNELLASMGYDTSLSHHMDTVAGPLIKELKQALMNMYFFGKVSEEYDQKFKERWKPISGDNVGLLCKK
jgi:hypothetical protein